MYCLLCFCFNRLRRLDDLAMVRALREPEATSRQQAGREPLPQADRVAEANARGSRCQGDSVRSRADGRVLQGVAD